MHTKTHPHTLTQHLHFLTELILKLFWVIYNLQLVVFSSFIILYIILLYFRWLCFNIKQTYNTT